MKARLEAMSAATSQRVMMPAVEDRARHVQAMAQQLAPYRTGTLQSGIVINFLKAGVGYYHVVMTLTAKAFYGIFQEFGLGDKRTKGKLNAHTLQAHARYAARREAHQRDPRYVTRIRQLTSGGVPIVLNGIPLTVTEKRKQMKNRYGERHNMAAQPFFRPAVNFSRNWFVNGVIEDLFIAIGKQGASQI